MIKNSYTGYLLAAHPKRKDSLHKGVILVIDHTDDYAIGLQINKVFDHDISLDTVMTNMGLTANNDSPLYNGGPINQNRIHIIHSLDWFSRNTVKVNDNIGVSHDIGILAALSANEGPECYRVIAGSIQWNSKQLDYEISNLPDNPSITWNATPANVENIFDYEGIDQWIRVTDESVKIQVSSWF